MNLLKKKAEIRLKEKDLKHKETFYKQIPNLLTFIRLIGAIPAGIMYYLNTKIFIGAISFLWFTDAIDGRASPRKPNVFMKNKSSSLVSLLVA